MSTTTTPTTTTTRDRGDRYGLIEWAQYNWYRRKTFNWTVVLPTRTGDESSLTRLIDVDAHCGYEKGGGRDRNELNVRDNFAGDRAEDPATERQRRYLFRGNDAQHQVADGQVEYEDGDVDLHRPRHLRRLLLLLLSPTAAG